MTTPRTVLKLEQLGARVLPSTTAAIVPAAPFQAATVQTATTVSWGGSGRFTLATASATHAKTYTLQGSVQFGSGGFLAVSGSVTTVGNKSGQATGKIVLSDPHGTLTLSLTGPTQSANAGVPATFTYKVLSGTGTFAHYSGTGTMRVSPTLFPGIDDRGNFTISGTTPKVTVPVPPTPTPGHTITGPSWTGQGRFAVSIVKSTAAKAFTIQGSADFGSSGFFAITGSIQTVGNKSGQATGKITLSDHRGTLVLAVTGSTQSANSGLPAKFTYKVVSGTGFFAHYAGQGTVQLAAPFWPGYSDKGHFTIAVKPTAT
jgi:DNA/RNA endonuclease YhcR with UshA esterase domain